MPRAMQETVSPLRFSPCFFKPLQDGFVTETKPERDFIEKNPELLRSALGGKPQTDPRPGGNTAIIGLSPDQKRSLKLLLETYGFEGPESIGKKILKTIFFCSPH